MRAPARPRALSRTLALLAALLLALACGEPEPDPEALEAARAAEAEAAFQEGVALLNPEEGEPRHAEALEAFRRAGELGHSRGQTQLGMAYLEGKQLPRDIPLALEWFRKAADQNHPRAQFELGRAYRDGIGVEKDRVEALKWLILSSHGGGLAGKVVAPGLAANMRKEERQEAYVRAREWRIAHPLKSRLPLAPEVEVGPGGEIVLPEGVARPEEPQAEFILAPRERAKPPPAAPEAPAPEAPAAPE